MSAEAGEWTSWFNVDHPGGDGDFESLAAIRFYYGPARVCPRPLALEARTTNWALPAAVGERVHLHPTRGFWCLNREQPRGRRCSNYHVRFRCPRGKVGWAGLGGESCGPQWAEPGGWAWSGEGSANGILVGGPRRKAAAYGGQFDRWAWLSKGPANGTLVGRVSEMGGTREKVAASVDSLRGGRGQRRPRRMGPVWAWPESGWGQRVALDLLGIIDAGGLTDAPKHWGWAVRLAWCLWGEVLVEDTGEERAGLMHGS